MNTYVKTFESFITEGKNWMNFDAAQMASKDPEFQKKQKEHEIMLNKRKMNK